MLDVLILDNYSEGKWSGMSAIQMISIGKRLSNIYAELSLPICRKYGINQTCFDILLFFANNPEYNTARDVCALRGIKSGIASVSVETLICSGLLERTEDERDRRKHRLKLTEQAAPIVADGQRMQKHFSDTLRRNVTEDELRAFHSLTEKLEENLACFGKKDTP